MKASKQMPLTREDLDVLEFIARRMRSGEPDRSGMEARARAYQMQDDGNERVTRGTGATRYNRPVTRVCGAQR
ncbi:MAG TPA: hypothetical protein VGQ52_13865 [Gemmatimonadaceae bacterium]|jgi:hypothetical protein|nr:hypothetical protein [Gemmatimonadaceae bacterium]